MYLVTCNSTSKNWGNDTDYIDRLQITIYMYGPQEYRLQPPWHWGEAWQAGRNLFDVSWDGRDGEWWAEMNGENENAYTHIDKGAGTLKVGEKAGRAEWKDELYECRKDDGRVLYEDDLRETGFRALYQCHSDYICPFAGYNYTEGRFV